MKKIIGSLIVLLSIFTSLVQAQSLEVTSIVIEYIESNETGIIRIPNCNQCKYKIYEFDNTIQVEKNRQRGSIEELANEYWDVTFLTIFIKSDSNKVTKIYY